MAKVTIRQCPMWGGIRDHAARVAAELRKEQGLDVQVVDGGKGEFTVTVDGRTVAEKRGDAMPGPEEIKSAIRSANQQPARAAG